MNVNILLHFRYLSLLAQIPEAWHKLLIKKQWLFPATMSSTFFIDNFFLPHYIFIYKSVWELINIIFKESWFLPCLRYPPPTQATITIISQNYKGFFMSNCWSFERAMNIKLAIFAVQLYGIRERILPYMLCLVLYIFLESYGKSWYSELLSCQIG